jgi:hypothetical protein
MNAQEKVRVTIASGLRMAVVEIVKFHNLSKSIVKRVKRRYGAFIPGRGLPEDFEMNRKEYPRRSDTLDDAIMANLQQLVNQDPGRSMRLMARKLGLSN